MKAGRRRSRSRPPPGAGSGRSPARPSGIDPSGRNDGAVLPVRILAASPSPERGGRQPGGWWPPAGLRRVCSFLTLSRSRREVLSRDNLLGFHIIDDVARGSTASNMRLLRGEVSGPGLLRSLPIGLLARHGDRLRAVSRGRVIRQAICRSAAGTKDRPRGADAAVPDADIPHMVRQQVRRRPPPRGAFTGTGAASGSAEVPDEAGRGAARQGPGCWRP
jgi:hypothetical protein